MELSSRESIMSLLVTFILVSSAIVVLAEYPPQLKDHGIYEERGTILISDDSGFTSENGVTGGSGSADDPFLIEGWHIQCADKIGIHIVDSSAHVVIRNVWVERGRLSDDSPQPQGGVVVRDCGSVRVENSIIDTYRSDGIVISGSSSAGSSLTVSNCVFYEGAGVVADSIAHLEVTDSYFKESRECALNLSDCSEVSIARSGIEVGVLVSNCSGCSIVENDVFSVIDLRDSRDVSVTHNTIAAGMTVLRSMSVNVTDNWHEGDQRISFKDSSKCNVSRNHFYRGYPAIGVSLVNTTDCTVFRNHLDSCGYLWLSGVRRCSIASNIIVDATYERHAILVSGESVEVADNIVIHGYAGIYVTGENITVTGNTVRDCRYESGHSWYHGFGAYGVSNLTFSGNSMINNSGTEPLIWSSFSIERSSAVTIENNRVFDSMEFLEVDNISMERNHLDGPLKMTFRAYSEMQDNVSLITRNNFEDVEVELWSMPTMLWDEGYPEGGNYWSAYNGTDEFSGVNQNESGSDGIGDEPFQIDLDDIDRYPLSQPVELEDTTSPVTFSIKDGEFGKRGWFLSNVNVSLESWDATSQVSDTFYRLDDGPWTEYISAVTVSGDGIHSIEYFSADEQGNEETPIREVLRIDTVAPVPEAPLPESMRFKDVTITSITAPFEDSGSGICSYSWGGISTYPFPGPTLQMSLSEYTHALVVTCTDFAGNSASVETAIDASINEDRDPLSTTGPYGPFLLVALVFDIAVGLVLWHAIGDAIRWRRGGNPPKPSVEYDKDEVADGHELYHRAR